MSTPVTHSSPPNFLHWSQRPPELVQKIDQAFERISSQTHSSWGASNGTISYGLCGVKEYELMKRLILEAPAGQKDFYTLDIGAGDFEWGNELADYLNKQTDLPSDIRIHIIGIRGERYLDNPVQDSGRCKIYRLGGFKVEELESEFKTKFKSLVGIELTDKIDLTISNWCIRHLADPLGTVFQAYHMLRPKTGILLIDGFFLLYKNESVRESVEWQNHRIRQLFFAIHAPFITQYNNTAHSSHHFMLKRPDDCPLQFPMQYLSVSYEETERFQIGSLAVTNFKEEPQYQESFCPSNWPREVDHHGDKRLHEWLKQNHLLSNPNIAWQPLLARDLPLAHPPLHQAILAKDQTAINKCLEEGYDINESDSFGTMTDELLPIWQKSPLPSGRTPLHLALETGNLPLFKKLLQRGADPTLSDGQGKSVLHLAAQKEANSSFFTALLETRGIDLNLKILFNTPLDDAIKGNNLFAIQALLQRGVVPTYQQIKQLQNAAFSPIHPLLPKTCDQRPEFQQIIEHIKMGDTVILSQGSCGYIFSPENSNGTITSTKKLVQVKADPKTYLFEDRVTAIIEKAVGYPKAFYLPTEIEFNHRFEVSTMEFNVEEAVVPPSSVEEEIPPLNIRIRGMRLEEGKRD